MQPEGDSVRPFVWTWLVYTFLFLPLGASSWIASGLYKTFDFRSIYAAATLARTEPSHLYDLSRQKQVQDDLVGRSDQMIPFGHLALDALLYVPLSLLKYRNAYLAVFLCNAILIVLCFLAARQEFSETMPLWQPRPGLIFFLFMPITIAVAQGQDSLLLLLILCLGWKLLNRSHDFSAGLVLASLLLKPHLALLVALFVAIRFGRRIAAGFIAGAAIIAAMCLPFWLHGGLGSWLGVLTNLTMVGGHSRAQEIAAGIYPWAMPNLRGVCLLLFGKVLSSHALFVVVCLGSLALLLWGLVVVRRLSTRNAFAFSILLTALVSYNLEPHDLAILLLPMALIGSETTKALARCRDIVLGLPVALMIASPVRGAGFTLMSVPMLACVIFLGRSTDQARPEAAKLQADA